MSIKCTCYSVLGLIFILLSAVLTCSIIILVAPHNKKYVKINSSLGKLFKSGEITISFNTTLRLPNYVEFYYEYDRNRCEGDIRGISETRKPKSFPYQMYGIDQGHLVGRTKVADCDSTNTMLNIAPQYESYNRYGIWAKHEKFLRKYGSNIIIIAVEYTKNSRVVKDKYNEDLTVPSGFYVIVKKTKDQVSELIYSVYLPHADYPTTTRIEDVQVLGKLPYFAEHSEKGIVEFNFWLFGMAILLCSGLIVITQCALIIYMFNRPKIQEIKMEAV